MARVSAVEGAAAWRVCLKFRAPSAMLGMVPLPRCAGEDSVSLPP